MEDKKPSARKTEPKQVEQRRKQAFSQQLRVKQPGQGVEPMASEPMADKPLGTYTPNTGWDNPVSASVQDHPTDLPVTFHISSDAAAFNAPRMESAHESAPAREMPRQQMIRQHREQVRAEGGDNGAPDWAS